MAVKLDILESDRFFTNADFAINFAITQADGVTPQPITGWALSWLMKVRMTDTDVTAKIAKVTGTGITITNGPAGLCSVAIADTDTVAVRAGLYVHELKRTDNGFETPMSEGRVVLRQSAHVS